MDPVGMLGYGLFLVIFIPVILMFMIMFAPAFIAFKALELIPEGISIVIRRAKERREGRQGLPDPGP